MEGRITELLYVFIVQNRKKHIQLELLLYQVLDDVGCQ